MKFKRKLLLLMVMPVLLTGCDYFMRLMDDKLYTQLNVAHVYFGLNGPSVTTEVDNELIYEDVTALKASWVASALSEADFAELLSKVDFKTQFIHIRAEHPSVKKEPTVMYINRLYYTLSGDGKQLLLTSKLEISFPNDSCIGATDETWPFIIVVVDRPEEALNAEIVIDDLDRLDTSLYMTGCPLLGNKQEGNQGLSL